MRCQPTAIAIGMPISAHSFELVVLSSLLNATQQWNEDGGRNMETARIRMFIDTICCLLDITLIELLWLINVLASYSPYRYMRNTKQFDYQFMHIIQTNSPLYRRADIPQSIELPNYEN